MLAPVMANKSDDHPQKLSFDEGASLRRSSRASTDSNSDLPSGRRPSLLNMRRRSSFRGLAHSVNFMRRLSIGKTLKEKDDEPKKTVRYENTYRLEPDTEDKFKCGKVQETVERLINTYLREEKYDERRSKQLATDITTKVKNAVKDLGFKRYKIICNVIIGEKKGQGIDAVGRCCWDPKTDNFVTVHFENESLFAVCTVHGVYFD